VTLPPVQAIRVHQSYISKAILITTQQNNKKSLWAFHSDFLNAKFKSTPLVGEGFALPQ